MGRLGLDIRAWGETEDPYTLVAAAIPAARTESDCETSGNVCKPCTAMRLEWTSIPALRKAQASACCCR